MIPNQWYAILDSREVKRGHAIGTTRMGEKLVLWRDREGHLGCLVDLCPHRGAALSPGPVRADCIMCPFHGFEFDPEGRCRVVPANGRQAPAPKALRAESYPVRDEHGFIWLWWHLPGQPIPSGLPPVPFFAELNRGFVVSRSLRQHWPVHYSRAIENQLDVVHLPFIHAATIGRGNRTVVDGPLARLEDGVLNVWVYNRLDDGTPARRPSQIPEPNRPFSLEFRFPNLWENRISDSYRLILAFVPVDNGNTLLYLRVYQRAVRLPLLRDLAGFAMLQASLPILKEDRHVVTTQRPLRSELHMGEHLIQGDFPIILYRRHRQELIDAALRPLAVASCETPNTLENVPVLEVAG